MIAPGAFMVRSASTSEKPSLVERDLVSWGGYGLQISPCIEGTSSCGDSCCPNGYKCSSAGNHKDNFTPTEAICCPTDADCSATVKAVPACADSSWGLYHAIAEFCCPIDFVGVYPEGGNGLMCLSSSLPIPSDKLASSVKQFTSTKAAVTTPSSGSKTTSTSSGTVTSVTSGTPSFDQDSHTAGNPHKSGSLSKGATIAIAVLASALGLLTILVIGYFIWKRKQRSNAHAQPSADLPDAGTTNAIISPSAAEKVPVPQPAAAKTAETHVNELLGKNIKLESGVNELAAPHRAELHDSSRVQ